MVSPLRTAPRLGSGFLRSGIPPGASPPVGFASTSSRCVRLRRTALRAHPRMNAGTRPAEGAGGSRSKAAGELTLGLMSGEERRCTPLGLCSSVGAGLLAKATCQPTNFSQVYPIPCGSGLAREGDLPADQFLTSIPNPLWERACSRWRSDGRRYITVERTWQTGRPVGRLALLLRYTPPREAERRFCAVGHPAWMPG